MQVNLFFACNKCETLKRMTVLCTWPSTITGIVDVFLSCLGILPQFVFSNSCSPFIGQCSIAGKRHHDQVNSSKGKHLIGACLEFQRFSPLLSWWGSYDHSGKHGARKIAVMRTQQKETMLALDLGFETPKPTPGYTFPPTRIHLLHQCHTC